MTSAMMPTAYNAADVERRIYREWESKGYFRAVIQENKPPYVIIMPPPNVTGELHLGHALEKALEDALIRWRRMSGVPTLWLPGTDHAGIATQWAVERRLAEEGAADRHELGRERFLELVWDHVDKFGGIIHEQSRRLGISADWDRHRFTLEPGPSHAVRTTFVNLYQKGLIYRHERIINWCTRCATALSDLEVDFQDLDGKLYYIRYPMEDDPESHLTVASTRPETMLGDTGVAVHPDDLRYDGVRGRNAVLPIMDRVIPVVGDEAIDPEFGTGALKVTPGNDTVDFEIGQRHNLESIDIIGLDGALTQAAGKYAGVERFEARRLVVEELERLGRLEKVEDYSHSVGHCQRCNSVVEPLISLQWFVNVGSHREPGSIAGKAHAAVADGEIKLVPERFTRVYLNWLENIRDWCISRQLWWGHRIPVWYCGSCRHMTVAIEDPSACEACGSEELQQDPDVLDTWFSSGLWPHSTLGWPENNEDLDYFYPTTVLETGYDILFFWVARMIMLGIENTGAVPFRTVFLHGLIRDATGAKMSKTRGNTMDPLELVEKYGTDALRFALTTGTAPGNDLRFTENRLEAGRNFANKIWNASRFVISGLEGQLGLEGWQELPSPEHLEDRWIVSRLDRVTAEVNRSLEEFELGDAQQRLYEFIWNDYCDWYIEMAKVRMRAGTAPSPLPTLAHVLERTLRLLHPFMPFITEEIWQRLTARAPATSARAPGTSVRAPAASDRAPAASVRGEFVEPPASIMIAPFPSSADRIDDEAEQEIDLVMTAIRAVRNTRAQLRIPSGQRLEAVVEANGRQSAIEGEADAIRALSRVDPLRIVANGDGVQDERQGVTLVVNPLVVRLPLEGVVDLTAEGERLRLELADCVKNMERVEKLVSNPNFRNKAKPEVVEAEEGRLNGLRDRKQRLDEILAQLTV